MADFTDTALKCLKSIFFPTAGFTNAGAWTRGLIAALSAAMLLSAPGVAAKQKDTNSDAHWSDWEALGNGFVGRKKLPKNADKVLTKRRAKNVKKRLKQEWKLHQRALKKAARQNKKGSTRKKSGTNSADIAASVKAVKQTGKQARLEARAAEPDALWLRTVSEGLHGVAIAELAEAFAKKPNSLRKMARQGRLTITNAGNAVSWYFDRASDMVLFTGEAYNTLYTDENAYHLSLGASKGKSDKNKPDSAGRRKSGSTAAPGGASGVETPFMDSLKLEEEPDWVIGIFAVASEPDADYWFWDRLFGVHKDLIEVSLNVPSPADSGIAQMRIFMRGYTNLYDGDDHTVYAELNGQNIGSTLSWDGFDEAVLAVDIDQFLLDPSGENTLRLHSIYAPGTSPGEFLDRVEIDYLRLPVAAGGQLWLHNAAPGLHTVAGFTSADVVLVEAPGGGAVFRDDVQVDPDGSGGFKVTFESEGGGDFLVAERNAARSPFVEAAVHSDLRDNRNKADYLIIAPRDFAGTAAALADHRSAQYGHVKTVWLDDIYAQFSDGRRDPFAVARFMDVVRDDWIVSPLAAMLLGKGTLDLKDRMGYGDHFLPTLMISNPWLLAASDDRLLGAEDDQHLAIGRLPMVNDEEGLAYVQKLISYESTTPGDERYQAVVVADNPDKAGDFHANSDALAARLTDSLGFDDALKLYHPVDQVHETLPLSSTWNAGFVIYDGHGAYTQAGDGTENFVTALDAEALSNSSYPIFTALSCSVGRFFTPGSRSLAGALVMNPRGGAMAAMAPTGLSLDEGAQLLGAAFLDSLYGSNNSIGVAARDARVQTQGLIDDFMQGMYLVLGEPAVHGR